MVLKVYFNILSLFAGDFYEFEKQRLRKELLILFKEKDETECLRCLMHLIKMLDAFFFIFLFG